jgi:hypothetical protein
MLHEAEIEEQRTPAASAWLVSQHALLYEQALLQQQQKQNLLLRTIALQQQQQQQEQQQQQQQFPAPHEPLYAPQGQYPVGTIGDGILDSAAAAGIAATATVAAAAAAVPASSGRTGGKRLRPLMKQLQQQQLHSDSSEDGSRSKAMRYATRTCDLYPIGSQQQHISSSIISRVSRGDSEEGRSRLTDFSTNNSSSSSSSSSLNSTLASSAGAAPYDCSAADVRWQQQQQQQQQQQLLQQQPLQSWLPPLPAAPVSTGLCPADFDLIVPQLFDIDVQQQQQQHQQQLGSPLYEVVPWNSSSSSSYGNSSALHTASTVLLSQPPGQQHLAPMQASALLALPPPHLSSSNSDHSTAAAAAAAAPVSLQRYSPSLSRSLPVVPALHSGVGTPHLIESVIEPTPLRPPAVGSQHMFPPASMWDELNAEDHQQLQ